MKPTHPSLLGRSTTRNESIWGRSSAFSVDILARLNTATSQAIEASVRILTNDPRFSYMSAKQRTKAILLLVSGVTKEIEKFAETLRQRNITDLQ